MAEGGGRHADNIPLRGGHIVLDFLNTAGWHASDEPAEWLTSYDELLRWAQHAGVQSAIEGERLTYRSARARRDAARVLRRTVKLREALYRICRAFLNDEPSAAEDLMVVRRAYADAVEHATLAPTAHGHELGWGRDQVALELPLWRLARADLEFLGSGELLHTRECAGAPCGWLFMDRSRNGSRRWCSSEECGNRERARRHRARS